MRARKAIGKLTIQGEQISIRTLTIRGKKAIKTLAGLVALTCLTACLCGCAAREQKEDSVPDNPVQSVEKENEAPQEDGKTGAPAIQKQELMALEGADNPAGQMQDMCANIMVQVRAGNLLGSGVIVAADKEWLWIATAGHVLEAHEDGKSDVKIIFMDGYEVETAYVQQLAPQDVAILKVPLMALTEQTENGEEDHGKAYRRAILSQEAFEKASVGDLVIAMGSRSGAGEDAYAGTILEDYIYLEDFGANMMVAEVMATPGMSGGGLFDAKGRLLGIICGVSDKEEVAVSSIMSILALDLGESD